jgi:hypothetical protein
LVLINNLNNNKLKTFSFGVFLMFFFLAVQAQDARDGVKMLARPYADSIQLRWAPTSYELWQAGIKNGYVIERYTILSDKELVKQSAATKKVFETVKPWSLAKWEALADTDKYAAIGAEATYGEQFTVTTGQNSNMYDVVNLSNEQTNRFSFGLFAADMSPRAAKAMGLFYTDKTAKKNESYLYRVVIKDYITQPVDTGYVLTGFLEYRGLPRPLNLANYKQGQSVVLAWDKIASEDAYTAFMIERSINDEGFKPLNTEPLINPSADENSQKPYYTYVDTLPSENIKVQYRVLGISPFGERGPWSDTTFITGGPVLKNNPAIITWESPDSKTAKIAWDFPKEDKAVSGFKVMRSSSDVSGFKDISGLLPPQTREYIDKSPMPSNYYKVFAIGQSGDITMSLAMLIQPVDSFPPLPPTGLTAKVDSTGKVTLKWKANAEQDMYGYRVYRANNMNEEFSQITVAPVRDTVFLDRINIKTITRNVYYMLMAIDKRQNHSSFSKALEVKRPDFIAPVRPVFKEVRPDDKGVFMAWSSSTSIDVIAQELHRYTVDSTKKELVARFTDINTETFIDSIAAGDSVYHYRLTAIDDAGNRSEPANIAAVSGKKISSVITLKVKANRSKQNIELSWNAPLAQGVARYVIYRSLDDAPIAAYTSVKAPVVTFIEDQPTVSTKYTYAIRAQFNDGSMGAVSELVSVDY